MKDLKRKASKREMTAEEFIALDDAEKDRIFAEIEAQTPLQRQAQSRPLNSVERKQWDRLKKKLRRGRPRLGKEGVLKVSISVEPSLMKRADAYAKSRGLKRSEFFTASVR